MFHKVLNLSLGEEYILYFKTMFFEYIFLLPVLVDRSKVYQ